MKRNTLSAGFHGALPPQAAAAERPRIAPVMTLKPVADSTTEYELIIYGDIGESWWGESVTAQSIAQQLNALEANVTTINVRINSYGGSVADGLAIYNALKRHKATKAVTVDGVAMSSASLIAMAGDTVTMPSTSVLMIHAPWGGCYGNAKEMRQYADVLDKFSESMTDAYVKKSGMERAAVLALLTDGEDHYYTGEEAVEAGFADAATSDDDEGEPDESARAFAAGMLDRISARCPSRYAGLAVAAAMRGTPHTSPPTKPTPAAERRGGAKASAAPHPPASAARTSPAETGISGDHTVDEEEKKAAAQAALAADKARREAIRNQFAPFASRTDIAAELGTLQRQCEDDHAVTAEAAGQRLLELLGKQTTPATPTGHIEITREETATYRQGAIQAVLHRSRPADHALDERSSQFRGFTLVDLARDCAERAGHRCRGMSRSEIAVKAMQSTTDFPHILENVISKTLRAGYLASARTFSAWARQSTLPDFKQISRAQIAGAPSLKRVVEGAEYEYGSIGDAGEKYAVLKYGRLVAITWETVINDDLDALTRIPFAFGASAADLESDVVYAQLTANALMADGKTLFHADHGNLGTPAALIDAIHPDPQVANPLAEMRKLMLLQKGLEGRYITVRPKFLIVPPDLEEAALKVTNASIVAARGNDANVIGPSLTPVVEPRLHDSDPDGWYGAADPSTVDTVEYAYLEGHEGVFTETRNGFEVDGVEVKCRHVVGAKAIDYRGLFKNAGAAPTPVPAP